MLDVILDVYIRVTKLGRWWTRVIGNLGVCLRPIDLLERINTSRLSSVVHHPSIYTHIHDSFGTVD